MSKIVILAKWLIFRNFNLRHENGSHSHIFGPIHRDDHKRDLASRLKDDRKVAQTTGQSTGMEGISVGLCHELKLNEIDNT